jgi:ABC-2 type transport system ATP-binding protein
VPPPDLTVLPGVQDVTVDGRHVTVTTTAFDNLMARLAELGIESLQVAPPTLEDLFLHYYDAHTRELVR